MRAWRSERLPIELAVGGEKCGRLAARQCDDSTTRAIVSGDSDRRHAMAPTCIRDIARPLRIPCVANHASASLTSCAPSDPPITSPMRRRAETARRDGVAAHVDALELLRRLPEQRHCALAIAAKQRHAGK